MKPVRIGVVGCGAIAQVQHLPNLLELDEEFEIVGVCDVSPGAAEYVAKRFKVPNHVTRIPDLLSMDIDAVLLCHTDPKSDAAVDAFEAGKHVLVEKPIAASLQETDRMIDAQQKAGKVGQAAYMKIYDPGFVMAKREIDQMSGYEFVQINHLHPNNYLHLDQFRVRHFDDVPPQARTEKRKAYDDTVREAFGDLTDQVSPWCGITYGLIHDLYSLRTMLGVPTAVLSVEIWQNDRAITSVFEYANGARCVITRVDLNTLWDFKETLEVYGDDKRVLLSYPTGFSRRVMAKLVVQGIDGDGVTYTKEPKIPWDSAFTAELKHFHQCITEGIECRSDLSKARHDVELIIDITKVYATGQAIRDRVGASVAAAAG